jgi:uncharacterized membrane protein YhfC
MLDVAIISQIVLQIAFPVVLGWLLVRRYGSEHVDSLRVFLAGALSFAIAQATLLALTQAATMLGLPSIPSEWQRASSALAFGLGVGVLEELARFAVLRLWLREARSWAHGLMLGVGHGGAESVFSGVVGAVWYMTMSSLRNAPPPGEQLSDADQASLDQIVTAFFSTPWHSPIMAGIQQVCMVVLSMGLATLVMRAFLTGKLIFLPAAIGLHSLASATLIFISDFGLPVSLAASLAFAAVGLAIIWLAARSSPPADPPPADEAAAPAAPSRPQRARRKRSKKT